MERYVRFGHLAIAPRALLVFVHMYVPTSWHAGSSWVLEKGRVAECAKGCNGLLKFRGVGS